LRRVRRGTPEPIQTPGEIWSPPEKEREEPSEEKIESIVEDKPRDVESKVDELLASLENKEDT